jgi:ribosomal protein L21
MDIAALSMGLSQMKVAQQASISVMKMAMDAGQTQMNDMVQMVQENTKMMEQSVNPNLGKNLDISL